MEEINQEQREDLARRINDKVLREYDNSALRAYTKAEINSTTWKKAATADPTASPRSLSRVIRFLWPETQGDWRLLVPPLEGGSAYTAEKIREWIKILREGGEVPAEAIGFLEDAAQKRAKGA